MVVAAASAALLLSGVTAASTATAAAAGTAAAPAVEQKHCGPGARTLSAPGSHLYPDTGNGGYTSVHTLIHLVYDADANRFLPGTAVELTDRATQCLTSLSLDFERRSRNRTAGPDLAVGSVSVDGVPARWRFVQPTYPGDPNGPDDPDPAAHEASQTNPVGGPRTTRCRPRAHPSCGSARATPSGMRSTAPSALPTSSSSRRRSRSPPARRSPSRCATPAARGAQRR